VGSKLALIDGFEEWFRVGEEEESLVGERDDVKDGFVLGVAVGLEVGPNDGLMDGM
jgi:hypothetical protein